MRLEQKVGRERSLNLVGLQIGKARLRVLPDIRIGQP